MRTGWRAAVRWVVGGRAIHDCAASASQMRRFETEWLASEENLAALADLSGRWIDCVRGGHLPDGRGRAAEGIVPGHSAAYRRTASKTGSSVGTGTAECIITTGGVCRMTEKNRQLRVLGMVWHVQRA